MEHRTWCACHIIVCTSEHGYSRLRTPPPGARSVCVCVWYTHTVKRHRTAKVDTTSMELTHTGSAGVAQHLEAAEFTT